MKWLLSLASVFAAVSSASAACEACLEGYCHNEKNISQQLYSDRVAIDRSTNTLHFSSYPDKSYGYNLDNDTLRVTSDGKFWAFAVDQDQHDLYAANIMNGIYKLDAATNEFKPYALPDQKIFLLYYKDKIYFRCENDKGLRVVNGFDSYENIQAVNKSYISALIIDKMDDIYFKTSSNIVYRLKKDAENATIFLNGDYYVLSTDACNNAIFMKKDSRMYRLNYDTDGIDLIGALGTVQKSAYYYYQVEFDRDNNVVYYNIDKLKISYFKRSADRCNIIVDVNNKFSIVISNQTEADNVTEIYNATEANMATGTVEKTGGTNISSEHENNTFTEAVNKTYVKAADTLLVNNVHHRSKTLLNDVFKSNLLIILTGNFNFTINESRLIINTR